MILISSSFYSLVVWPGAFSVDRYDFNHYEASIKIIEFKYFKTPSNLYYRFIK